MGRVFKRKRKKSSGLFKNVLTDLFIVLFVFGLIASGFLFIWLSRLKIPDLSTFEQRRILQSTKIYDRTGEVLLYDMHQDIKRTVVPFTDISRHIKNAAVAIEDDQFYNHIGIDVKAVARAVITNLTGGDLFGGQGGSTITQQVIKNALLITEKSLTRKIKEFILALKLETELSKDEILTHYLNESPYGGTIYGIEEASQAFFGVSAKDVSLPQAAYLAALPQAPTRLSPYGNNKDMLEDRKNLVLERMLVNNFITEAEYKAAVAAEVKFQPELLAGIRAPHFVFYIKELLAEKFGDSALAELGLRVTTSLNWQWQQAAEKIVKKRVLENIDKGYNATNASLVAIDPKTGDILTMVGSRDYFDEEIDGNFNVALAARQPGSSIKPIVYASALEKGYTAETMVFDVKTQFSTVCEPNDLSSILPCYSPNNHNDEYKGPVNLRNALAQSLNIPAVKVLYLTGLKDAIKLATDMGINTLDDINRLGLTLVLGGGEVRLLEHTGAYGVLANEGVRALPRPILKIEDASGKTIEENKVVRQKILDREVALTITDILSDNEARTPLWGADSYVNFPGRDVAAKSGSTNDLKDAWVMGYTPNLAVGAWSGNNKNTPIAEGILSGLITAPMWREFMDVVLKEIPTESFTSPRALVKTNTKPILQGEIIDIERLLDGLDSENLVVNDQKTEGDEDTKPEADTVKAGVKTLYENIHSILHFVIKENPNGPYPKHPELDPQYINWEYGVEQWKNGVFGNLIKMGINPTPITNNNT